MVDGVGTLIASLKAAGEIAQGLVSLRDTALIQGKVIELQGVILSAQSSAMSAQSDQSALLEKVRDLERYVASLEAWDAEKQRYELKEVRDGALVYALKEEAKGTEPAHYICVECYGNRRKSILRQETWFPGRATVLVCDHCGSATYLTGMPEPEHQKLRNRSHR